MNLCSVVQSWVCDYDSLEVASTQVAAVIPQPSSKLKAQRVPSWEHVAVPRPIFDQTRRRACPVVPKYRRSSFEFQDGAECVPSSSEHVVLCLDRLTFSTPE